MLQNLDLTTLQERRKHLRLTLLYKVVEGLVPAIPSSEHLMPINPNKRRIRPASYSDFKSDSDLSSQIRNNNKCFQPIRANTTIYTNSYFPRTILEWNRLDQKVVDSLSVEAFRSAVSRI